VLQYQMIDKKIEKVFDAESILVYEAGKRAVINSKGELIVPWNQIDDIDKCEFGFYTLEDTGYGGGTTAFYTPLGKKIDSYGFFYMANLINDLKSQGIFRFTTGVDNVLKYGFVLKSGEVIEPYFNYANEDFSCGLCKIENDKGLYGYINTKGIVMTPCIYKSVESTCGSDLFQVVNENDLTGFVNTQGKLVIPCLYKEASSFYQGRSRFYKDGSYYSIYPDGRVVKD